MQKQDFQFDLPEALIASKPCANRSDSRLFRIDPKAKTRGHHKFKDIIEFLAPEDCLIFNNTRVIPARLKGKRESGGLVEVLIERIRPGTLDTQGKGEPDTCIAQIRASNKPKEGVVINFATNFQMEVTGREGSFYLLKNNSNRSLMELVEEYGDMPLPPYIQWEAEVFDQERYQTVYAENSGAVAAPTAGLHFDEALLKTIAEKGIASSMVTLHVGAGTFSPVRAENIRDHQMHSEWFCVPPETVELVNKTRAKGGRVIAVGTTSVRCLESASKDGHISAMTGETDIFIYPGYQFQSVDGLITNFHLSESTLIMLVSAFAGKDFILESYNEAIKESYRFFSYGDSMFIENKI